MKNRNWNFLVYVHSVLLLWVILFCCCVIVPVPAAFGWFMGIGMCLFLFVNIPLGVFSFILKAKLCFDIDYEGPISVLAVTNMLVGVAAWFFYIMLLLSPKFGG
ncbi:MAG: hypothetical protein IKU07_05895 [Oscillospiraceae bacterium]|nr:hypothetical protein [Oscillospiraceae bacterium]